MSSDANHRNDRRFFESGSDLCLAVTRKFGMLRASDTYPASRADGENMGGLPLTACSGTSRERAHPARWWKFDFGRAGLGGSRFDGKSRSQANSSALDSRTEVGYVPHRIEDMEKSVQPQKAGQQECRTRQARLIRGEGVANKANGGVISGASKWISCAVSVVCFTLPTLSWGQAGVGSIEGSVMDPITAMVSGASVEMVNPATNSVRKTITGASGLFTFTALRPGDYQLTVEHQGFKITRLNPVAVEVDRTSSVAVKLEIGSVIETVEITAETQPLLNTTDSSLGNLIDNKTLETVPLNGRDPFLLVQLSASVVPANGAINNTGEANRPGLGVSAFRINGLPEGALVYMFDGSALSISGYGDSATSPALTPPLDSIQEFRMETSSTSATVRNSGAGVISMASKAGGNALHGSAFIFDRPNGIDANDPFIKANQIQGGLANKPPDFERRQWGGSVGGHIKMDKLFYFADYENTRAQGIQTETTTLPTEAERAGNFADVPTIYNPYDVDSAGKRNPFPGNVIPKQLLSAVALNMQKLYPMPNLPGSGPYHSNNYFDASSYPDDADRFDVRPDYHINDKQLFFARYSYMKTTFGSADHYHNGADPGYYLNHTMGQNVLLAYDYAINPNSLIQLRYSFARHAESQPAESGLPTLTDLGFPAGLQAEQSVPALPYIDISGVNGVGSRTSSTGFRFIAMYHDANILLDAIHGRHDIKAGFEWRIDLENVGQPLAPSGSYRFDTTATSSQTFANDGYGYASFLLGMGSPLEGSTSFTQDPFLAMAAPYYASFIEDTYHVTPKLTIVAGLRWEVFGGRTERHDRQEYFDPTASYSVNGASLTGGEVFVRNHHSPYASKLTDFGPHLGVNFGLTNALIMHAGGGIFYGPSARGVGLPFTNSDSFIGQTGWDAVKYDQYGNTTMLNPLDNPFPNGLIPLTQGSLGLSTNLGHPLSTVDRNQPDSRAYNWDAGLQYRFGLSVSISADYVGSRGLHEAYGNGGLGPQLNQMSLEQIASYNTRLGTQVPNPFISVITDPTSPIYHSPTIPFWEAMSTYPQFTSGSPGSGPTYVSAGLLDTNYNALVLKAEKRFTSHWNTQAAFTWSKTMSDGSLGGYFYVLSNSGNQDWRNLNLDYSVDAQDVPLSFIVASSYDLPFGRDRLIHTGSRAVDSVIGGWSLNAVVAVSSGVPIPANGSFPNQSTYFNQRPDLTCDPGNDAPHTSAHWFLPNCYAAPASPYVAGDAPRLLSSVRADGTHNIDLSLFKNFRLGGERNLQLRVESFNFTNSVQLGIPNSVWNPKNLASFGQVTSAASSPRQIQFGARYTF